MLNKFKPSIASALLTAVFSFSATAADIDKIHFLILVAPVAAGI